jgi:hypothetical protein
VNIRYSQQARGALEARRLPPVPELLYFTASPCEVPLVLPAWARSNPVMAAAIDAGHALRAAAGLPESR